MDRNSGPEATFSGVSRVDEVARELGRVVDRLNSLPIDRLTRAHGLGERCHTVAVLLADSTRALGEGAPDGVDVPVLGPNGWGAQLAVLGRDYLEASSGAVNPDVLAALVDLRRALP